MSGSSQYFLVISTVRGSQQAVAVFSSQGAADTFVQQSELSDLSVQAFTLASEDPVPKLHCTHKPISGGAFRIVNLFEQKFKAQLSLEGEGFSRELVVDCPDPEVLQDVIRKAEATVEIDTKNTTPMIEPGKRRESGLRSRHNRKLMLLTITVLLGAFSIWHNYRYFSTPQPQITEENVEFPEMIAGVQRLGPLPQSARGISFFFDGRVRAFELEMDRDEFALWTSLKGVAANPIEHEPVSVTRYCHYTSFPIGPDGVPNTGQTVGPLQYAPEAKIASGFYFKSGGSPDEIEIEGAFDESLNRLYFHAVLNTNTTG